MAWSEERSRNRIANYKKDSLSSAIGVQSFAEYFPQRREIVEAALAKGESVRTDPVLSLSYNQAITTHGVHVYANLTRFNDTLTEKDRETEASHKRALQFLHLHYGACDQLVSAFEIQRIDFHGGRLHAVVLTPEGQQNEGERVRKAIAFAAAFREMVLQQSELFGGQYSTDVCIGIDSGRAIAINSGRGAEPEPLFIGSPANHAAKLAESGLPGINLSQRTSDLLNRSESRRQYSLLNSDEILRFSDVRLMQTSSGRRLDERWREEAETFLAEMRRLSNANQRPANFIFHAHAVPLRSIKFEKHPPSNAIRMGMASVFADICGYTAYIDAATTPIAIAEAVRNLHIIRREFVSCTRDDFGAKKVRFIGDCLHAVSSKGQADRETADEAIRIAGALRSSFSILQQELVGIADLDLAIGIEIGDTPISRLGLRGSSSVRCSASKATCASEELQSQCSGGETKVGPRTLGVMSRRFSSFFNASGVSGGLDDQTIEVVLQGYSDTGATGIEGVRAHCE